MRVFEGSGAQMIFIQPEDLSQQVSIRKRCIGARVVRVVAHVREENPRMITHLLSRLLAAGTPPQASSVALRPPTPEELSEHPVRVLFPAGPLSPPIEVPDSLRHFQDVGVEMVPVLVEELCEGRSPEPRG